MDTGERGGVLEVAEGVLVHGDDRDGREQVEDEHRSLDGQHPARRLTLTQRTQHEAGYAESGLQQLAPAGERFQRTILEDLRHAGSKAA